MVLCINFLSDINLKMIEFHCKCENKSIDKGGQVNIKVMLMQLSTKLLGKMAANLFYPAICFDTRFKNLISYDSLRAKKEIRYIKNNLKKDPLLAVFTTDIHNSGISIGTIKNGKAMLLCNNEEERFGERVKYTNSFPYFAIKEALEQCNIQGKDIDLFGFSWNPINLSTTGIELILGNLPGSLRLVSKKASPHASYYTIQKWRKASARLGQALGLDVAPRIYCLNHHVTHAASYYFSPFEKALIWVADGFGDKQSISVWRGEGNQIVKVYENDFNDSFGMLYGAMTLYAGFPTISGEGKFMGLSAFGNPDVYYPVFKRMIRYVNGKGLEINWTMANWNRAGELEPFTKKFRKLVGPRIDMGTPFCFQPMDEITRYRADLAAAFQKRITEVACKMIQFHLEKEKTANLVMTGGFSLNCPTNQKVIEELGANVYIPPNPSDTGTDAGGVVHLLMDAFKADRPEPMDVSFYCGRDYSHEDMGRAIRASGFHTKRMKSIDEAAKLGAKLLFRDKIIAWFQGKAETGPRALGNRSILANPGNPEIRDIINKKVKYRELYRPLCPSVLEENFCEWFETGTCKAAPFMAINFRIKENYREKVRSVVHNDGTCRVQTVNMRQNEWFYKLIKCFYELSGIPMVLNTSFNVKEPIVQSPDNAVATFVKSSIDYLFMGPFVASRDSDGLLGVEVGT
jgi:carbamoyltransferase